MNSYNNSLYSEKKIANQNSNQLKMQNLKMHLKKLNLKKQMNCTVKMSLNQNKIIQIKIDQKVISVILRQISSRTTIPMTMNYLDFIKKRMNQQTPHKNKTQSSKSLKPLNYMNLFSRFISQHKNLTEHVFKLSEMHPMLNIISL